MPGSLRCTPANPKRHKNTAQEKKTYQNYHRTKNNQNYHRTKNNQNYHRTKKNQAHVLKCHHCKNPDGFEYGNKVETGTLT